MFGSNALANVAPPSNHQYPKLCATQCELPVTKVYSPYDKLKSNYY